MHAVIGIAVGLALWVAFEAYTRSRNESEAVARRERLAETAGDGTRTDPGAQIDSQYATDSGAPFVFVIAPTPDPSNYHMGPWYVTRLSDGKWRVAVGYEAATRVLRLRAFEEAGFEYYDGAKADAERAMGWFVRNYGPDGADFPVKLMAVGGVTLPRTREAILGWYDQKTGHNWAGLWLSMTAAEAALR